jgi:hypothetical protein
VVARSENEDMSTLLARLATALDSIAARIENWPISVDVGRVARTVRGYLLPRIDDPSRPLTVVFAGPTGAGKSTLLNSIVGADVSSTGAVRPTTRAPIALVSPEIASDHFTIGDIECDVVMGDSPILEVMTLVDTPDLDSTETKHRLVAETLVDHADIVVFITSALRYADYVPWQVLRRAHARGSDVISVLNRVSPATTGARVDFRSRLAEAGLEDEVVSVSEHHLSPGAARVPPTAVRFLRRRLAMIATDRGAKAAETLQRVLEATMGQVGELIVATDEIIERRRDFEEELSLDLADELETIRIHGAITGLHTELGDDPRRVARWLRRNRRRPADLPLLEARLGDRLIGLVRGEMRHLVDAYQLGPGDSALSDILEHGVGAELPAAVAGWLRFVRHMAEQFPGREWSAQSALVDSASSGVVTPEAQALFGDDAGTLVERARRDLVSRLQAIVAGLAQEITDSLYPDIGPGGVEELRSAHGAMVSRLAPVHA